MVIQTRSTPDWETEKGKNYMPVFESIVEEKKGRSTSSKHEIPTWYDLTKHDSPHVVAYIQPLLRDPMVFFCAEDEKSIDDCVGEFNKKGIRLEYAGAGGITAGFLRFLEELKGFAPKDWFGIVDCIEYNYRLGISVKKLVDLCANPPEHMVIPNYGELRCAYADKEIPRLPEKYILNGMTTLGHYLVLRAADERHPASKKVLKERKAYIRALMSNRKLEDEGIKKAPVVKKNVLRAPEAIVKEECNGPAVKISTQKAPEEIKEDAYGDPTDDYGNVIHVDENGRSVQESEEIREDEYDRPVPEEGNIEEEEDEFVPF